MTTDGGTGRTTSEPLRLPVPDAVVDEVSAVVHRPTRPRPGAVALFLVHGAGGDLDDAGLVALTDRLAAHGHVAVRANLPYRESGRRAPPRAERVVGEYRALLDAVRSRLGPRRRWVAGGRSFGGRVASLAVADGLDCAGLLLVSYPLHPPGKPERLRVDHWPEVTVPCLFLQGARDPFGSPDELRPHLAVLAGGATVEVVPGGDHSLRVAGTHAPDGVRRGPAEVVAERATAIAGWLDGLG